MGSADIMRRNLYNRVEVIFPVLNQRLQRRLKRVLYTEIHSTETAWELKADHHYYPRLELGETPLNSQDVYLKDSFGLELPQNTDLWWETQPMSI
jgi:polyphosphate kinase